MDVAKNITLPNLNQLLKGLLMSIKKEREVAQQFISKLDIRVPSEKTNIMKLSGGNQQKTVLAKWLNRTPDILLLDEPTRGIDVGAKVEIYRLISDLAKQGVAILLVTSELPELIAMGGRFLVLANGGIQTELSKAEVSQQRIMEAATCSTDKSI